jgi:hypothetical protein
MGVFSLKWMSVVARDGAHDVVQFLSAFQIQAPQRRGGTFLA